MIAFFTHESIKQLCKLTNKEIAFFMRVLNMIGVLEQEMLEMLLDDEKLIDLLRKVKLPDEELPDDEQPTKR